MGKYQIDKRIAIVLFFLVAFLIANNVLGFSLYPLLLGDTDVIADYSLRQNLISIGFFLITMASHIVIAIWLNIESKKLNRNRLVWTVFGLFFGITAAILFYLIEIYNEVLLMKQRIGRIKK
jgi:uncharacterized protein YacL